jgi:hypothetical protein
LAHRPPDMKLGLESSTLDVYVRKQEMGFPVRRATLSQYLELGEPQAAAFVQHTLRTLVRQLWSTELGPEHRAPKSNTN